MNNILTKMVFTDEHGEYTVGTIKGEYLLDNLVEEIIEPVLRAAGYVFDSVEIHKIGAVKGE